jgi:hypothetical protein
LKFEVISDRLLRADSEGFAIPLMEHRCETGLSVPIGPLPATHFINIENEMGGQAINQCNCISQVIGDSLRADGESMILNGNSTAGFDPQFSLQPMV